MSKFVKNLVTRDIADEFKEVESVAVINPRGINATKNNQIRRRLNEKGVKVTVVKNSLAKRALAESRLKGFESLLEGPSALVYGKAAIAAIARALLEERKTEEKLELRGIFFDGEVYAGLAGVEKISKMPTREEAIANILGAILGPGRKLAAAIKGPGGRLGAVLKSIEEKARERGDAAPAEAPGEAVAAAAAEGGAAPEAPATA